MLDMSAKKGRISTCEIRPFELSTTKQRVEQIRCSTHRQPRLPQREAWGRRRRARQPVAGAEPERRRRLGHHWPERACRLRIRTERQQHRNRSPTHNRSSTRSRSFARNHSSAHNRSSGLGHSRFAAHSKPAGSKHSYGRASGRTSRHRTCACDHRTPGRSRPAHNRPVRSRPGRHIHRPCGTDRPKPSLRQPWRNRPRLPARQPSTSRFDSSVNLLPRVNGTKIQQSSHR
jgi:hypothetical protein